MNKPLNPVAYNIHMCCETNARVSQRFVRVTDEGRQEHETNGGQSRELGFYKLKCRLVEGMNGMWA
jgi:hypothetical protein